jgi:hypothetical protein
MKYEANQTMVDWVIGVKRNKGGKVVQVFDSRKKPLRVKAKNILKYLFTGKKTHNTMTNAGFGVTSGLINNIGSYAAFTYAAIGTGTTNSAATDTALQTEVKRKVGTASQQTTTVTNDTSQWDTTFSSSDSLSGTTAITEVGILNASSGGTLLVHFASSTVMATCTWANGDTFEVIVKIKSEQGS